MPSDLYEYGKYRITTKTFILDTGRFPDIFNETIIGVNKYYHAKLRFVGDISTVTLAGLCISVGINETVIFSITYLHFFVSKN